MVLTHIGGFMNTTKKDRDVIAMLYRMVNECNAHHVAHGSLYSELSEMIRFGAAPDRVDSILAQLDGKRR